ncbi:MAG: TraB/GumN family protein [Oscillospiraceae bacterium]
MMKKYLFIFAAALAAAAAVAIVLNSLGKSEDSGGNDSIYVFKKNTTLPEGIIVFPDEKNPSSDITPAMWEVSDENGNLIYMMGTMHTLKEECYPLPESVKAAFEQAEAVAFENNSVDARLFSNSDDGNLCGEGDSLKNHLSEETYSALTEYFKSLGKDIADYEKYTPSYVYQQLDSPTNKKGGFSATLGIDRVLQIMTNISEKELVEVESYEMKREIKSGYSDELCDLLIMRFIEQTSDDREKLIEKQYEAWKTGDLEAIEQLTFYYDSSNTEEENKLMEEYYQKFILGRNKLMTEKAEEMLSSGKKTFFLVGLSHFVGDEGIIALLEKDGFTCKRIS